MGCHLLLFVCCCLFGFRNAMETLGIKDIYKETTTATQQPCCSMQLPLLKWEGRFGVWVTQHCVPRSPQLSTPAGRTQLTQRWGPDTKDPVLRPGALDKVDKFLTTNKFSQFHATLFACLLSLKSRWFLQNSNLKACEGLQAFLPLLGEVFLMTETKYSGNSS